MFVNGKIIKSWVFKNTLFFLVKINKENEPIIFSARDLTDMKIRKDGSIKFDITNPNFKKARGESKQYFGSKKAFEEKGYEFESDQDVGFNEYDPFNEDGYLDSPDEEMLLIGTDPTVSGVPNDESGVPVSQDPTEQPEITTPTITAPIIRYDLDMFDKRGTIW